MSRRLLLLLLSPSGAWATPPATVNIGGLFPMFKTSAASYAKDASGIDRLSAFKLAIDEINDKTDGVADNLLPNTQLLFAYRDSKRDDQSAFCAPPEDATHPCTPGLRRALVAPRRLTGAPCHGRQSARSPSRRTSSTARA